MPSSYQTAADARTLAAPFARLPGFGALLALDDNTLDGVLTVASMDIDAAMRYQGRRWDLSSTQTLEFPRIAYGDLAVRNAYLPPTINQIVRGNYLFSPNTVIWDWDDVNHVAVVPCDVKVAQIHQAAWIMQPQYAARLEAIRSGVAAQAIGTGSETLAKLADMSDSGLCQRAEKIMAKYRLRTGAIL